MFIIKDISLGFFVYLPALLIVIGLFFMMKEPLNPNTTKVRHNILINMDVIRLVFVKLISCSCSFVLFDVYLIR